MISRIWKGITTKANAEAYEELLINTIFPEIKTKNIKGFTDISLLRRKMEENVEFVTIMKFSDMNSVKDFAGKDYAKSYVPDDALKLLLDYDKEAKHYNLIINCNN